MYPHARLRCMCTCNRCTFCICQNFLNSDLLQSVKNKIFTAVLNRHENSPGSLPWRLH
ncbi:RHOT1 isoform 16, partial [Pan troglodytes]